MTENSVPDVVAAAPEDGAAVPGADVQEALREVRQSHPLKTQLEALLIVAEEPLDAVALATAADAPVARVREALAELQAEYDGDAERPARGFELREVAGGYRFYVRESLDPLVAAFVGQQSPARLSQAALETLAVVAYKQPISRGAIAQIRAVNVDSVVRTLLARGLITEVGQDPVTTATLYGTTEALLRHLGISDLQELPPIAPFLSDPSEEFAGEQL